MIPIPTIETQIGSPRIVSNAMEGAYKTTPFNNATWMINVKLKKIKKYSSIHNDCIFMWNLYYTNTLLANGLVQNQISILNTAMYNFNYEYAYIDL